MPFTYFGAITSTTLPVAQGLSSFDAAIGYQANLTARYLLWGQSLPVDFLNEARQEGSQVMLELMPRNISLQKLLTGAGDSYLRQLATQIEQSHQRLLLSFAPEMNGRWNSWGPQNVPPSVFVEAWRHVHNVINAIAGSAITWVWQISRSFNASEPVTKLKELWPGSKYVQRVGIDGYFYQKSDNFFNVFGISLKEIQTFTNEPVIITETSIGQRADQVQKIPVLFAGIRYWHVVGFIWFDRNQKGNIYHQDWQLEGHPLAIAAIRRGLSSVGMKPMS